MPRGPGTLPRRGTDLTGASIGAGGGLVRPNTRRIGQIFASGSGPPIALGDAASLSGSATLTTITAANPYTMYDEATAATLNAFAFVSGVSNYRWSQRPTFQAGVAPGAVITVGRWWLGYHSAAFSTLLGTATPGSVGGYSGAAFRYDTGAGDTSWQAVTFGGTSQTITPTGVVPVVSTAQKFEISDNGSSTVFKIGGQVVATHTANRPADTVTVRQGFGVQTLEAVIKSASMGWLYTETD